MQKTVLISAILCAKLPLDANYKKVDLFIMVYSNME